MPSKLLPPPTQLLTDPKTGAVDEAWYRFFEGMPEMLDEDDMASDSASAVPSQQSVKAYVDAAIATTVAVTSGSWTPALAFGGASTGITYATQVGRYIRTGDVVNLWGTIALTNNGTALGLVTITGLPFAASTVAGLVQSGCASSYDDIEDAGQGLGVSIDSAASVLKVLIIEGDIGDSMLQYTQAADNITNVATLSFAITYRTG